MKKQNKKLQFLKNSITELTDPQIKGINGGCQFSDSSGPTKDIKFSIIDNNTSLNNTSLVIPDLLLGN
ncbi:class I lanthipeptide [Lacinutrix sp. Hel_I_90]|uniref:class I lanthipeptide n=1 Tax=Lacinutrix sp. Hel_I_90 TaxID=1249999 RepID=UPI0005CB358E|nr:class I lanthipeptide [Lacinutrix sp. Hel_I_90]